MQSTNDHPLNSRRQFIKKSASALAAFPAGAMTLPLFPGLETNTMKPETKSLTTDQNMIGPYGPWAANLPADPPLLSFRQQKSKSLKAWRKKGRKKVEACLGVPDIGQNPKVKVKKKYTYDGLEVEELSWQLPYGRPTEAILLKPEGAKGPLPGILGLHDHGGNKYFAKRKITKTGEQHSLMAEHQKHYYQGKAWANEIAKRGYVVLVPDNFTFGSRRVFYQDVGGFTWGPWRTENLSDTDPENPKNIEVYNDWAAEHEHIMAKSLFCGGTTWPGVFLREDQRALDVLCARPDVDARRVGCGGLSGGGLRTAYLGGVDSRIQCSVCVGFMTTWRDLLLNKCFTHTWMAYIPILPKYLDFPEVYGLRAPLPTMVLNNSEDQLFTLPEMQRADRIMEAIFTKAKAEDRYQCNFYAGAHKFDQAMQKDAFAWFDRWLNQGH